ncbi:MAG: PKD domain-containing protein, partial [Gammaproteobacteria bacterium]|nr:PKD domain-containing protein [Gammaproteobacteria bacterium]
GASVQFDGSGSMDPDGSIVSYSWDFGDGSAPGTGVGPVHIYTASGTYTVVLTVTDDQDLTGSAQTSVEITDVNVTVPPVESTCPTPDKNPEGEQLYNTYCASCHGAGGKAGDVMGESADDIMEAIKEESQMGFLADVLSASDIDAIAAYLNSGGTQASPDRDYQHDGMSGDDSYSHDGKRDDDGDHDKNSQCDTPKNDGNNGKGKGRGSSNKNANPFATGADTSLQSATTGGGALNWLVLVCSGVWLAIRRRRRG